MAKLDLIITELRQRICGSGFRPGDIIPTQKELARELGVSVVTIGQAMRWLQKEGVIASTRGKGTVVSQPRTNGESKIYGLIITADNMNDPVLVPAVTSLQKACREAGIELRIFPSNAAQTQREQLRAWAADISVCFVFGATKPVLVRCIEALGKTVIFYGEIYREDCPRWAGQITVNIEMTSLMSLQFLLSLGHRNILLVRSGGTSYLEALGTAFARSAAHLHCGDHFFQLTVPMDFQGEEVLECLREEHPEVTAVIVNGGMRASRVLHTLTQGGVRVPDDISLFAINAVDVSMLITPHLSRVDNMPLQLGEKLLSMAGDMMAGDFVIRERTLPTLVWGKTVRQRPPEKMMPPAFARSHHPDSMSVA